MGAHLVRRAFLFLPMALQLASSLSDRTRSSCSAVRRAGSLAARREYVFDAYFDLEKVRAFAMRHTCTHP